MVQASVVLEFGDHGGSIDISFKLTLLPVKLPSVTPLWLGYLGALPLYPEADWPEVRVKQLSELGPSLQMMSSYGFTAATGGAGGPDPTNETLADFSFSTMKRDLSNTSAINSYLGSAIVGLDVRQPNGASYNDDVKKALTNIAEHAVIAEWPEFYQTVGDEPQGTEVDDSLAVGAAFAAARKTLPTTSVVGKTSVFTSVLNVTTDYTTMLLLKNSTINLIIMNEHSQEAVEMLLQNGHQWMLYNAASRFRAGFYLAMASHVHNCLGMYNFAFSSVGADPYYALDAREDDLCAVFTTSDGTLIPVLDSLQTLREGATDLRYTTLLRSLIAESPPRGNATTRAEGVRLLAQIDSIPLGATTTSWNDSVVSTVRKQVVLTVAYLIAQ